MLAINGLNDCHHYNTAMFFLSKSMKTISDFYNHYHRSLLMMTFKFV
jgi:hypothetical protein